MYKYWHSQKRAYRLSTHLYDQVYIQVHANELAELYCVWLVRPSVFPSVCPSICPGPSAGVVTLT